MTLTAEPDTCTLPQPALATNRFPCTARNYSNSLSLGPLGITAEAVPKAQKGSLNVGRGELASSKLLWDKGVQVWVAGKHGTPGSTH